MRMLALKVINSDTLFKVYENTNLNLIPVISNKQKKVYVLTGPLKNGIVVFGNDYLLTFNDDGELITKKRLHKNIITINYANENADSDVGITMHSHLPETGDFITATDVCTLLLYSKFAGWSQHYVISQNYVSIWDCKKEILAILTMEAWEKITNDKEKKQKNK